MPQAGNHNTKNYESFASKKNNFRVQFVVGNSNRTGDEDNKKTVITPFLVITVFPRLLINVT